MYKKLCMFRDDENFMVNTLSSIPCLTAQSPVNQSVNLHICPLISGALAMVAEFHFLAVWELLHLCGNEIDSVWGQGWPCQVIK